MKPATGIEPRHARSCPAKGWESCRCNPAYQANVWSKRTGRIRKTFPTLAAAKSWRTDALHGLRKGTMAAPTRDTIQQAADELIEKMRSGEIRTRKGKSYKPSETRSCDQVLQNHVLPEFGTVRLSDLDRNAIQDFADALLAQGLAPSTVRNIIMPLRIIYRRAIRRGAVNINPTRDLELPAVEGKRDRYAEPAEAVTRLEALRAEDRALWATAIYAGLDNGELQALQVADVDLEAGVIHVRQSWDKVEGFGPTKTEARSGRRVPICEHVRQYLEPHIAGRSGFAFGTTDRPYHYDTKLEGANKVWKEAGLGRFTFHDGRRSFRTYLDAIPAISEVRADFYMGHANPSMRARYVQRMEGQFQTDAAALDEYLAGAESGKIVRLGTAA